MADRAENGLRLAWLLLVAPWRAWPWWSCGALVLLLLGVVYRPTDVKGRRSLGWLALSPVGWLLAAATGGWLSCDRIAGDACEPGYVAILPACAGGAGLVFGAVLVARLKGARVTAMAVWVANLAYTALAVIAAAEEISGVSL